MFHKKKKKAYHKQCIPNILHNSAYREQFNSETLYKKMYHKQCNPNALHNYANHKQYNSNAFHN